MKILFISNMYPSARKTFMGIYVKNQFEELKTLMPESTFNLYYKKYSITSSTGSMVKYLMAGIKFFPWMFKKFDVIHVQFFYPLIILAYLYKFFHKKVKIVTTFHGSDLRKHIVSKRNEIIYSKIISKTDFVIAVGNELADEIETKLNRKVDEVLCAGVDRKVFFEIKNTDKIYDYLFVGNFSSLKGIDIILESIKDINLNFRFCFVGSGPMMEEIIQLKNKNITILKNLMQNQLCEVYNQSRFLVVPSRSEAFGLVVTEAMFCGTPSIISTAGGLTEQIINGENGFILKENNVNHLKDMLLYTMNLSDSTYDKLRENCLRSNHKYALNHVCQRLKLIYNKLHHAQ